MSMSHDLEKVIDIAWTCEKGSWLGGDDKFEWVLLNLNLKLVWETSGFF